MASESTFQHQIKSLMFSCGDSKQPHPESAQLVENFTRQQMKDLISCATQVASLREGRMVQIEDVMFLLRKDKVQLKRLIRYLELKDQAKKARKSQNRMEDEDYYDEFNDGSQQSGLKGLKLTHDFLTPLQKAELSIGDLDELEIQRREQQDVITSSMNAKEYLEFSAAKATNLYKKNSKKFKEWIGVEEMTSPGISPDVFDVIGHLAQETVRKLVELSLEVRADMEPCQWSCLPVGKRPTLALSPITHSTPAVPNDKGNAPFVLSTPPSSPPANILSSPLNSSETDTQVVMTSNSLRRSSRETRKRGRAGVVLAPTEPPEQQTMDPAPVRKHPPQALKPSHVQEALRRLSQTHLTTPVGLLWTHKPRGISQRSWCL